MDNDQTTGGDSGEQRRGLAEESHNKNQVYGGQR